MVKVFAQEFGLNLCLKVLGVAKTTFYSHKNKESTLKTKYQELKEKVIEIITDNPSYGYRRIKQELKNKYGIIINHKSLKKLLKLWGLTSLRRIKGRRKSGIEKILEFLGEKVNLLPRFKNQPELFELFFTDFTRLVYQQGEKVLWFCPFLEAKTKMITGWGLGRNPSSQIALDGFWKTKKLVEKYRENIAKAIIHQDQGSVFKSYEYVGTLIKQGVTLSYSRKGKFEDNSQMESFFGRFKDEWRKVIFEAKTEKEVKAIVKKAIGYYNRQRIHSNHNCSPFEFLKRLLKTKT